jgi:hypothetical protein
MSEKRLGELTEQELQGMMDFVFSEEFDQMPASEFFGTLRAMDEEEAIERVVIKGHVEDGEFVPHAVEGATLEGHRIRINRKALLEIQVEAA